MKTAVEIATAIRDFLEMRDNDLVALVHAVKEVAWLQVEERIAGMRLTLNDGRQFEIAITDRSKRAHAYRTANEPTPEYTDYLRGDTDPRD